MPSSSTPSTSPPLRPPSVIMNSWNASQRPPSFTRVRTGSSDIGSTRASTPTACETSAWPSRLAPALAHPLGAQQAHRQVAVAQPEPGGPAGGLERRHHLPAVAGDAPAALVDQVGQPPGHEIRVGRDVHAVDLHVVAGVGDHRQLARAHHVEHPAGELGAARAAGEDDYHVTSGSPVSFTPACALCRTFTEISSGVRASIMRASSSLPQSTGRRPGI